MSVIISEKDWATSKPKKYRNTPTTVDGIRFDSKKEAARYSHLRLLEKCGQIRNLKTQPRFAYKEGVEVIFVYYGDFEFFDCLKKKIIIEDVKSPSTAKNALYRLKKKLIEARFGIEICEHLG